MSATLDCALCGHQGHDVALALVEFVEPVAGKRFDLVPRCHDRISCRERVELVIREPWPVRDSTPAPARVGL